MSTTLRRLALAAASTGLVAAGTTGVTAAPAQAAAPVCNVDVVSLTSFDLSDNDGNDEIKIKLGDSSWAGPWDMPDDWTRNNSLGDLDKDFTKKVVIRLAEQDLTRHEIGRHTLKCTEDLGDKTLSFKGEGAIYHMDVTVTER
ncbi:MAG: hypothetical protein U0R80_00395 [Nocardioidaceae bacterium]